MRKILMNGYLFLGLIMISIVMGFAFIAVILRIFNVYNDNSICTAPSGKLWPIIKNLWYILGADRDGGSVFFKLMDSAKTYIVFGTSTMITAVILGTLLGMLKNLREDKIISEIGEIILGVIQGFPVFGVILLILVLSNNNIFITSLLIGCINSVKIAKLIRIKIDLLRRQVFIESAMESGYAKKTIIFKQIIIANCLGDIILLSIHAFLAFVYIETMLGFLGIRFNGKWNSWGIMLFNGLGGIFFDKIQNYQQWVPPALAVFVLIVGLFFTGEGIKSHFKLEKK